MPYDYAVHSDFLIHWTGKDLDCASDPDWANGEKSLTDSALTKKYLERLHSILKYGLWLTAEPESPWPGDGKVTIPSTPKVCFTELKLSESRNHARRYGIFGLGFKRPYLFARRGRPLVYYGYHEVIQNDQFLKDCGTDIKNKDLLNYFKPMNSSASVLNYDLYSESEWRIIGFHELLLDRKRKLLVDPRDTINTDENVFFKSLTSVDQDKLKLLAPLDGWFAMVIYPSLAVKNAAQQNKSYQIHEQISRLKTVTGDHGNRVEHGNWPIEVDLDSCRHF